MGFSDSYERVTVEESIVREDTHYKCKHCNHVASSAYAVKMHYFATHVFSKKIELERVTLYKFDTEEAIREWCNWNASYVGLLVPGWYAADLGSSIVRSIQVWISTEEEIINNRVDELKKIKDLVGYREEEWYLIDCEGSGSTSCNLTE